MSPAVPRPVPALNLAVLKGTPRRRVNTKTNWPTRIRPTAWTPLRGHSKSGFLRRLVLFTLWRR
ncbi:unnamed protein product [Protopolystoma xenopodis]|uniref:Uncharacterized protein n=1 Tax=Protopolystoma xenopodis TaxID=117903 RepID=A0A3S5BWB8_9PLAT|nr:unnamed protein product [Protopolystoma xenopodis]